jgi:hypothetical protein
MPRRTLNDGFTINLYAGPRRRAQGKQRRVREASMRSATPRVEGRGGGQAMAGNSLSGI